MIIKNKEKESQLNCQNGGKVIEDQDHLLITKTKTKTKWVKNNNLCIANNNHKSCLPMF